MVVVAIKVVVGAELVAIIGICHSGNGSDSDGSSSRSGNNSSGSSKCKLWQEKVTYNKL